MAQNITLLGASYSDVPAVTLPKTGGGTAKFTDVTPTTASASDVAQGKIFFDSSGSQQTGTASGSNTFTLEYQNENGVWSFTPTYADIKAAVQQNKVIDYTSFGDPAIGGKYGSGYATNVTIGGVTFTEAVRFYLQDFTFGGVSIVHYGYSSGQLRTQSSLEYLEPQGTLNITTNGTHDVSSYANALVNVSGSSKNAQAHQSTTRATSSSYTSVNSFTCEKTGTYSVYWSTMRSSTSGTWGSQLYIGGSAYGSAQTGSWSNHVQNIHLTGVQIAQGKTIDVRARSRGNSYYAYVPLVTIIEEE